MRVLMLLLVLELPLRLVVLSLIVAAAVVDDDAGSVNGTDMAVTTVKQVWVSLLLMGIDEGPPPPPRVALSRRPCHNRPTAAVARSPIRSKNARRVATEAIGEAPSGRKRTGARAGPGPGAETNAGKLVELVWLLVPVNDDVEEEEEEEEDAVSSGPWSVVVASWTKAKLRLYNCKRDTVREGRYNNGGGKCGGLHDAIDRIGSRARVRGGVILHTDIQTDRDRYLRTEARARVS